MKQKSLILTDILMGIFFTFLFISIGLFLAINLRVLYYYDIEYLNIEEISGLSKEVIIENYNTLIDYCSPFYKGELQFPSIAQSVSGTSHFAEVKVIFNLFFYIGIISFCLLLPLIFYKKKKKQIRYLLLSSITSVVLPVIVGLACAINFEKAFVLFHHLFFQNDDWMFDPYLDPVILLLPETFFLHCAIIIIATVCIGSAILSFLYYYFKHHKQ